MRHKYINWENESTISTTITDKLIDTAILHNDLDDRVDDSNTKLEPMICERCGGSINPETLKCEHCGTYFRKVVV